MDYFRRLWPNKRRNNASAKKESFEESLYGRPLQEVDPLVFDGTFCVITKKYSKNYVYRFSQSKSLFLIGPLNPLRKVSIFIVTHQWFDISIILTILANCVTLAMTQNIFEQDPANGGYVLKKKDEEDAMLNTVEFAFLGIYTFEMCLKVISKGFIANKYSYMRSRWNILDFLVVSAGYFSIISEHFATNSKGQGSEFEVLRTLRVLRAVKTMSILPGLRMMINALLSSMVQLLEVMALTVFCIMIFALFAQEVFMGKLRQKCVTDIDLSSYSHAYQIDRVWTRHVDNPKNWLTREFPKEEYSLCSNDTWARKCPSGYVCLPERGENPDDGWSSFDNFFASMLTTFQIITLDYWERVFDLVISTSGPLCIPLFVMVVFLGSYYLLNLMLAVVTMSYEAAANNSNMGNLTKNQKLSLVRSHSTFSFEDVSKLNIERMTHYHMKIKSEPESLAKKSRAPSRLSKSSEVELEDENVSIGDTGNNESVDNPAESCEGSPFGTSNKTTARLINTSSFDVMVTMERKQSLGIVHHLQQIMILISARIGKCVDHAIFELVIMSCIVCNTLLLACERHGQPAYEKDLMEKLNIVFMAIFTAEAILKIGAMGKEYFKSGWNVFDVVIVLISIVDLNLSQSSFNLSVIRGMRLLRVFKLAKSWITMKILLNIIFSTFEALSNLTLVLLIVLYIFSVMGMQVIGGKYLPNAFGSEENYPRWNFSNFWYSFMMVFRVLCGEWIEPLWDCLLAHKTAAKGSEWKCFMLFLPVLIIGNFVVLNLFLALLLNSFNAEEIKAQKDKEEAAGKSEIKAVVGMLLKTVETAKPTPIQPGKPDANKLGLGLPEIVVTSDDDDDDETKKGNGVQDNPRMAPSPGLIRFQNVVQKIIANNRKLRAQSASTKSEADGKTLSVAINPNQRRRSSIIYGLDGEHAPPLQEETNDKLLTPGDCIPRRCWEADVPCCRSLRGWGCWTTWDAIRQFSVSVVGNPAFEWITLTFIFASSITLAFEDKYLDEKPRLKIVLLYLNFIFTGIFVVEMLLKWVALGFWTYFTNIWTILDSIIVVVSLISIEYDLEELAASAAAVTGKEVPMASSKSNIGAFKALRTFRAFRPLRAISRWQGMKMVVNALMYAIPAIFNVLLVCLLFWLVFSIMGVQFFKGKFYKCIDNSGAVINPKIVATRESCCSANQTLEYSWINTTPNFDNVFEGYLSLFQIATFEGWMELMRSAVDATQVDFQPVRDNGFVYYAFFVVFIVFGSFFTLNLFIGIIIDNFNMLKKKYEGNLLEAFLTPSQRHYYAAMKKLGAAKPTKVIKRPNNCCTGLFYDIAMSRNFEISIFFMIFLNMITMGIEHYQQSQIFVHMLTGFNSFFTTIYAIEAVVKILGLRHHYFSMPWNVFDFILVLASIIDLLVADLLVYEFPIPPTMLRIVRVFRIGRVLRLVKAAKGVRKLLFAFVVSLPALFNIGALLCLITFIYAILGMALFKDVAKYNSIDDLFNFETFLNSFIMLFRLMTAAGWNDVLDALTNETPVCGNYRKIICGQPGEPECPSRPFAIAFLVTYIIITYLIVINMYIAIILENFGEANREEQVGIVEEDLEAFYVRWSRYDPQATQFINFEQLSNFLAGLDPPLSLPKPNTLAIVAFNLPIAKGSKIHCLDVLHALVKHVLGEVDDDEEFQKMEKQMEQKFARQFPTRKALDIISTTRRWKLEENSAIIIQRSWRSYQRGELFLGDRSGGGSRAGGNPTIGNKMLNRMGNFLIMKSSRTEVVKPNRPDSSSAITKQPSAKHWNSVRTKMLHKQNPKWEPIVGEIVSTGNISGALSAIAEPTSTGSAPEVSVASNVAALNFSKQLSGKRKIKKQSPFPATPPIITEVAEDGEPVTKDNISVQVHNYDKNK